MIQVGTYLNVVDNSGGKLVCCIKLSKGYRNRYSQIGDVILVSVKSLRRKKNVEPKVKKGEIVHALIIRTKSKFKLSFFESINFNENSVILLTNKYKCLGTRIFGSISKQFLLTRFLKIVSLSSGLSI